MDLSEVFKIGFKKLLEKNYQQKTLQTRMDDFSYSRKQTRNTFLMHKRNLDINNMSPYKMTPEVSKVKNVIVKPPPVEKHEEMVTRPNKRLEMLKKWKEEKEKRKQEEKKKAKPIFKVCRVSGLPTLGEMDKDTKVKQAKPQEKNFVSKFAPNDHKFRPPKNIKPIKLNNNQQVMSKHVTTQPKWTLSKKEEPTRRVQDQKPLINGTFKSTPVLPQKVAHSGGTLEKAPRNGGKNIKAPSNKNNLAVSKGGKYNSNDKIHKIADTNKVGFKEKKEKQIKPDILRKNTTPKKTTGVETRSKTTRNETKKKLVALDIIEIADSSDEGRNKASSMKKRYPNTPRRRKTGINEDQPCEDSDEDIPKENRVISREKKNQKTPQKRKPNTEDRLVDVSEGVKTPKRNNKAPEDELLLKTSPAVPLVNDQSPSENRPSKEPSVKKKVQKSASKKAVDWNIEAALSDEDITEGTTSSKKKYPKTPRKNDVSSEDDKDLPEENDDVFSCEKKNQKTPQKRKTNTEDQTPDASKNVKSSKKNSKIRLSRSHDELLLKTPPEVALANSNDQSDGENQPSKEGTSSNKKRVQKSASKKSVDWNIEAADEDVTEETTSSKKAYPKTHRKRNTEVNSDGELPANDDESISSKKKNQNTPRNRRTADNKLLSQGDNAKTPKKNTTPKNKVEVLNGTDEIPLKTPLKTPENIAKSPVRYISPFVTISRGKESARKEYQVRQSTGGTLPNTPNCKNGVSSLTSPKAGADYFESLLNNEITRLESVCSEWEKYKETDISEEAISLINVTVGQSKLLISKKFEQFRSLINECRNCQFKEKPITCTDLHGFWDMVYMQVENVEKRFANLEAMKANNWEEVVPEKKVIAKKQVKTRSKKATASSSSLREAIKAARSKRKQQCEEVLSDSPLPQSPVRETRNLVQPGSARRSLRVSVLNAQASKRASSSPGLMMMKVSQAIKSGDGLTPSRSILKTKSHDRSEKRMTKSVLFKDDLDGDVVDDKESAMVNDEDKENGAFNVNFIEFSPVAAIRRSQRLSKR